MGCLASFQNSRIRPRKATVYAITHQLTVAATPTETVIHAANPNRTYLTLRNLDPTLNLQYGYPSQFGALLTQGFLLKAGDAVDLESTEEIRAIGIGGAVAVCYDEGSG